MDLYGLEDSIFCDKTDIEVCFEEYFQGTGNLPFQPIPKESISSIVFSIADQTLRIYDYASQNYSFSIDFYDYWLSLKNTEKASIDITKYYESAIERLLNPTPRTPEDVRIALLVASKELSLNLVTLLEELGKTEYSLMPSTVPIFQKDVIDPSEFYSCFLKYKNFEKVKIVDIL